MLSSWCLYELLKANRMVMLVSQSRHIKDKNMATAVCSGYQALRALPTLVSAHTFCASRGT